MKDRVSVQEAQIRPTWKQYGSFLSSTTDSCYDWEKIVPLKFIRGAF
jgi:hypothetical protein